MKQHEYWYDINKIKKLHKLESHVLMMINVLYNYASNLLKTKLSTITTQKMLI